MPSLSLSSSPEHALLAATALHLSFQAVVTVVVYPALAEVPPERFAAAHDRHSRRVSLVVGPVYALLAAACGWALLALPPSAPLVLALVGSGASVLVTAAVAAPTHSRLGSAGPEAGLLRRLLRADRVRLLAALLAAAAALWLAE